MNAGADHWERVEEIFARACELAPGRRAEYLTSQCGEDAELRSEIESLLVVGPEADEFFDGLDDAIRHLPQDAPGNGAERLDRIGPYEVLEEIGRGGMGIVYRARDTRLGRLVAIKLLPPWLSADPAAKERLAAEARSASAIDHPNIAALYDVVDTPSGALALVMAHYEGETLSERIARAPLPVDEAMEIARQVASGLTAAHRHGIVHRDIKPANLFLTRDGLVKILDFGVAKALRAGVVASRSGRGAGTAAYMSPEQVRGIEIDHRTDLWSLGVVLHEMVTGMRPFPGDREAAVMRSILEDQPPPPDPPGGMAPPHLARILAVLLAKDPDDRYPDAATLLSEVTTRGHRPRLHLRSRVTAAIVLGLLLVLGWAVRPREPASETPVARVERVAVLPFVVHGSAEFDYLGEAIVDLLSTGLDGAGEMRAVDPATLLDQAGDEVSAPREAERLAARFGAQLYVLGDIIEVDGRLRVRAVAYDRSLGSEPVARANVEGSAEQMFNLVDELAAQLLVGLQVEGADRHTLVARRTTSSLPALKAFLTGRRALRQGRFRRAVESLQLAVAQDSMFALAYYELSKAAAWGRQMTFSTVAANRSLELADRLPERERLLVLAYHAYLEGKTTRAEGLYRQVLAAYPSSADAWVGMGELLFHYNPLRGRPKLEAVPYFERAIEFDPRFGEATFHLMQVAVWQNDRQRFEALLGVLPDEQPVWRTLGVLKWGTAAEQSAALGELAFASEHAILLAMEAVEFTGDLEMAERVARLLDEPSRPVEWRALARHGLAEMELGRGRARAALKENDRIAEIDPNWAILGRALLVTSPLVVAPPGESIELRQRLEKWDPRSAASSVNDPFAVHDAFRSQIKLYLLGVLDVQVGDLDLARTRVEALERTARGDRLSPSSAKKADVARALAAGVRARIYRAQGELPRALEALADDWIQPDDDEVWSPILAQPHERLLRGDLLLALDRPEEALVWYRSVDELYPAFRTRAPAILGIARAWDALGNPDAAAQSYRKFTELWRDADPELQAVVDSAESRLVALQ